MADAFSTMYERGTLKPVILGRVMERGRIMEGMSQIRVQHVYMGESQRNSLYNYHILTKLPFKTHSFKLLSL
jgi:hypothetical protein